MNRIDICKNTIQSIKDYITTPEKLEPHLQKNHFVRKRKLSLFQVITALYFKSLHALLVNSMLDDAAKLLSVGEKPIIHSDRGVHYRWPGWIDRMEKNGFIRSMSKKGCSPDNSACEGVFGRIKNEMFYNADWSGVNISEFIGILNDYLYWYPDYKYNYSHTADHQRFSYSIDRYISLPLFLLFDSPPEAPAQPSDSEYPGSYLPHNFLVLPVSDG